MKLLVLVAVVFSAPSPAALLFHQQIQDYEAYLHSFAYGGPPIPLPPNYVLTFTGPIGTKTFYFRADGIHQMVLGSLGAVAFSGEGNMTEWVDIIEYADTPVDPWQPFMRLRDIEIGGPMFPGGPFFQRDQNWTPLLYIQYGQLFAQMRGVFTQYEQGNVVGTWHAYYTYNFQYPMGVQAIPEPATIGLFAAGSALVIWSRRKR